MKKAVANEFKDALNLDLHPIVTPNTVLTDNINGTFITYNGNEFCLQNDWGNISVADLSEGFIPIGIKEYNGILYIVSVRKLEDSEEYETEIGTYPSPRWRSQVSEGFLNFEYSPLYNLYEQPYYQRTNSDGAQSKPFVVTGLGYTPKHPLTVEIQPSYDGSVNLILTDGKNKPRIINSGFSVLPDEKYKIIDRNQTVQTNRYNQENIIEQLTLIRANTTIVKVNLVSVEAGGQLKGGNYKFYIKFGDSDYNQTDVVAESGIVSIFNGKDGEPSTISGTILDERTNKMVELEIVGLNNVYSKIYVYYSREYSDTLGYRMTESGMFTKPFEMEHENAGSQKIWLTGFEDMQPIDIEELNVDYHTIDSAKAQTQQANMLFLGNIVQSDTYELYENLKRASKDIITSLGLGDTINPVKNDFTDGKDYYSTQNIYYKLGYWPDEWYRFGIVYILNDGSTTPVFNMPGKIFTSLEQNTQDYDNIDGVFKTPRVDVLSESKPLYFSFKLPNSILLNEKVRGWFIVRQKRIPTTICQGLRIGIDKRSHLPVTWNGSNWITQSFLSSNRSLEPGETGEECPDGKKKKFLLPDQHVLYPMLEYIGSDKTENSNESVYSAKNIKYVLDKNSVSYVRFFGREDAVDYGKSTYVDFCNNNLVYEINSDAATIYYDNIDDDAASGIDCYSIEITHVSNGVTFQPVSSQQYIYVTRLRTGDETPLEFGNLERFNVRDGVCIVGTLSEMEEQIIKTLTGDNNRFIVYKKSESINGCGLLSLDPFVNHRIGSMLDGSLFSIRQEYNTKTFFGKANKYASGINNNNTYLRIDEEFDTSSGNCFVNQNSLNEKDVKCVSVSENTGVKVVDSYAFSTVAGSAADAGNFKYTAEAFGVYAKDTWWPWDVEYYTVQDSEQIDTEYPGTKDYLGYNSTHNINLVRGNFVPFIGIGTDVDQMSHGIYSIRIRDIGDDNAKVIRSNDNSEYYCVSERFDLRKAESPEIEANVYGGDCYFCTIGQRIITNFIDNTAPTANIIVNPGSWELNVRRKSRYGGDSSGNDAEADIVDYSKVNLTDVNTVDLGYWVTYKCLSSYNLGLRSVDSSHSDEFALLGSPRSFYPLNGCSTATGNKMQESYLLNDGLSATVGRKRYNLLPDVPYSKSEFANRIMFSNVHMTDAFANGYRTFQGLSYRDYDKQYGAITKLVSWGQNIMIIMEHGIGIIPINEKALMQTTTGEAIHIYGYGVLPEQMSIVSQDFGSKYEQSVVRTPIGVYGIDTEAKKIWRVTDKKGFETISDMKIESLLNDTINSEYDIDMPNEDVRTNYNIFKGDLIFTWKDNYKEVCICFNERQNAWTTKYDWRPIISENKNGEFYSLQSNKSTDSNNIKIWHHTIGKQNQKPTNWYGEQHGFEFEFVVSDPIGINKIFDDIEIISNNVQPNEMEITVIGDDYMFKRDLIQVSSEDKIHKNDAHTTSDLHGNIQNTNFAHVNGLRTEAIRVVNQTGLVKTQIFKDIYKFGRRLGNIQYKEGVWHSVIEPFWYANKQVRIRDKWAKIRIKYSGENLAVITAIRTILNV